MHSQFSNKKYWQILDIKFNEKLTNDVVSFEQPGPGILIFALLVTEDKNFSPFLEKHTFLDESCKFKTTANL